MSTTRRFSKLDIWHLSLKIFHQMGGDQNILGGKAIVYRSDADTAALCDAADDHSIITVLLKLLLCLGDQSDF